ncbi:hypothetical protein K466DRAFT_212854 [Polyporus arcularius HHB13444]|uniref:Uncharacterized protein n=1 Tax=Polyporus arcularius HHB13444 TaxID=1314778 RepID=A0A5C3P765_9APHY|nr:hypothetical protein K466DRAFT_212854 [Polyporus arcularius HHB13444]
MNTPVSTMSICRLHTTVAGPFRRERLRSLVLWTTRATTLLGEAIVLAITIVKLRRGPLTCRDPTQRRSIAEVVLTNGVLCFSIPLFLNTLIVSLTIAGYDDGSSTSLIMGQCIVPFRDAITSILISRFLLDLGSLSIQVNHVRGQDDSLEERFPSQLSYVVFASPGCDVSAGTVRIE